VHEALRLLGVRRLLLGIHDPAFPSRAGDDLGRGTPSGEGAADFLEWVAALGLGGLQLGPQGETSDVNPSPYDGTAFSRNPVSIDAAALASPAWGGLVPAWRVAAEAAACPGDGTTVAYPHAFGAAHRLLDEALAAFRARRARGEGGEVARLDEALRAFRASAGEWLDRDALHQALAAARGGRPPGGELRWAVVAAELPAHLARHAPAVEGYAFVQLLLHEQHRALRSRARSLGLLLYGDLQVGLSERDAWGAAAFLMPEHRLGAPPSRTNPEGQPWGYPLLDPDRYRARDLDGATVEGPAIAFLRARVGKLLAEFDGLRLDHTHGLVCPWVYRPGPDPLRAVQEGARLFASPGHPDLARYAIAREDQLDRALPRHHDAWERDLDEAQVARYATLMDVVMEVARARGEGPGEVAAEVLSTCPLPLALVLARHGLGRFRVTQKADLSRPGDVYRSEGARPEDWIMLGNHDTPTIWAQAARWAAGPAGARHAAWLAERLRIPDGQRPAWCRRVAVDGRALAQAHFADLFVGPAAQVQVWFGDLLGATAPYNEPGTVKPGNWAQRVPRDWRARYRAALAEGRALDLPAALAAALRARGGPAELVAALERDAGGRAGT
jgi:4-alpha-glucanotransferase